mmetsp:Transcript_103664/g.288578  ORF Transcript_103664/g.288578 Transcript_103664/m.288578 type:complete len:539 (+) Transcript_103664:53-1669(+)
MHDARPASGTSELHQLHKDLDPAFWCITRQDLDVFEQEVRELWQQGGIPDDPAFPNSHHEDPDVGPSIYQVNEYYIKPTTLAAGGMSWALMRNPGGLRCDAFVTHAWSEGVFEFCRKLRRMRPRRAKGLYCCFLANPQNANLDRLLGGDLVRSPFALALETAKYLLVLPNSEVSIYTRLWCAFEADLALQRGIRIVLPWCPKGRELVKASLPGALLCAGAIALYVGMPVSDLTGKSIAMLLPYPWVQTAYLFLVPVAGWWPRASACALLLAVGLHVGAWSWITKIAVLGGTPWTYIRTAWMSLSVDALFGLLSASLAREVLVAEVLKMEANQLTFTTVAEAVCTCERDALRIREAIRGRESEIDKAVRELQRVGRFDRTVSLQLARGMSPERARHGVAKLRLSIVVFIWVFASIVQWLVESQPAAFLHVFVGLFAVLSACVAGDGATCCIDVLFWTCTLGYIVDYLANSVPALALLRNVCYWIKLPVAAITCMVFYSGLLVSLMPSWFRETSEDADSCFTFESESATDESSASEQPSP